MSYMLGAPMILLKEGTDSSQGKSQILSNITACIAVADIVRATLGPRGMDKLMVDKNGNVNITNDGATIMGLLNVSHPAARLLADIATAQDNEVGDGTTSVVLLAGELLKESRSLITEGVTSNIVINGYSKALALGLQRLEEIEKTMMPDWTNEQLVCCAQTALNSKLLYDQRRFFAEMAVDAVQKLGNDRDKTMIGIKQVPGGSCTDSFLVKGVAFQKTFSYAGFEQQPKSFCNPLILALHIELELKAEKDNAEVRINAPDQYQAIVDAEWQIIHDKLSIIASSGANVVLSRLPIGDLATQFFADRKMFCAGRVDEADLKRVCKATGASVQTGLSTLKPSALGTCGMFEEKQVGKERYNFFHDCAKAGASTVILRGGSTQFIDEAARSLNDAIMVVIRGLSYKSILPGAGSIEMELSRYIREQSFNEIGKEQLAIENFAKALEVIPKTLAKNSGHDSAEILNRLRHIYSLRSAGNQEWPGVNCFAGGLLDAAENFVWELAHIKKNVLLAATEAACLVLSVDETIKGPSSQENQARQMGPSGRMRGMRPRGGR